jgi:hypothetical protein
VFPPLPPHDTPTHSAHKDSAFRIETASFTALTATSQRLLTNDLAADHAATLPKGEPPNKVSIPTGAVFLSYASLDARAAQRISCLAESFPHFG